MINRFPKDCWNKKCPHFTVWDLSIDDLCCYCELHGGAGINLKLIPISERSPELRCWFYRTNKSVKYEAKMVNTNPLSENRYMNILVCNKCALNHQIDFIEEETK